MSTYNWDISQSGNIRLTGKMVPAGVDPYPLLSAGSLDWDGVEIESGTTLNTTDDLLNYIKGGNSAIIGRIDELELSNAGYEIRCDKSVCYVGDIVGQGYQNQKLPVSIYKNGTLLSWTNAYTDGITFDYDNFTKPSGGNDLIHWSTSDCYLSGTANKAGTYIFNFKRNGVNIASYTLTVLLSPYKSTLVVVYTSSNTNSTDAPLRPTGGRYDFDALDNNLQDVEPWQTSVEGLSGVIWFCTGYVSQETPDNIAWGEPNLYLSKLGTPGTNWKITTLSEGNILVPVMYARSGLTAPSPNDDCLTISPNYIRSYKLENQSNLTNDSWRIQRNGEAYFAKGQAVFNSTGAFHIGGQNGQTHAVEANGTTSLITDGYIDYNPISGTLQIGGLNVSITGVDYTLIGVNVTNSLSGDSTFIGTVANAAGVTIKGSLNTDDVSVGNGACFFKGDNNTANTSHGALYTVGSAGSGHLANGNIKWDNGGNVSVKGNIEADSMTIQAATFASIDNTTGKMWFTNYLSAKAISGGVILNASVALRDDDPVILFKRLNENEDGYDFFVLNPLLLGNGSTTVTTQALSNLSTSIASSIDGIIYYGIINRWLNNLHIDKIDVTSGGNTTTTFGSNSSDQYLYMVRIVQTNCLLENDNHFLIHVPYDGSSAPESIHNTVLEITRFDLGSAPGSSVSYKQLYIYPSYTCLLSGSSYSVTRDVDTYGKLMYNVSNQIVTVSSSNNNTVVSYTDGQSVTTSSISGKKYLAINSTFNRKSQNSTSLDISSLLGDSNISGSLSSLNFINELQWNCYSGLNSVITNNV